MAEAINVRLDISCTMHAENNNDGVSLTQDDCGTNQNNFPQITLTNGDSVNVTGGELEFIAHGTTTIGAAGSATLDFSAIYDRATDVAIGGASNLADIYFFLAALASPDGSKKFRIGPHNDAGAVTFGLSPVNSYMERVFSFVFEENYAGSRGSKIIMSNNGGSTITVYWTLAGNRV